MWCFTTAAQFGQAANNQKTRSPSFFHTPKMFIMRRQAKSSTSVFRHLLSFGTWRRLRLRTVSWDTVCPQFCLHYISTVYCYQPKAGPFFTALIRLHYGPEFTLWCWTAASNRVVSITLCTEHCDCMCFFATDLKIVAEVLAFGFWPDGFKALD